MPFKVEIQVVTRIEGFHTWKDAPEEVAFLRNRHRHLFHVKLALPVKHNDRDKEFFIYQRKLNYVLVKDFMGRGDDVGSCEMIATRVLEAITEAQWCEVSEDGENGARVERAKS